MSGDAVQVRTDDRWLWALVAVQLLGGTITTLAQPGTTAVSVVPILLSVGALALALRDWRALGAPRPFERFHWLWAIIPPVYVIGRGAFLYRATGKGLVTTVASACLLAAGYLVPVFLRLGAIG